MRDRDARRASAAGSTKNGHSRDHLLKHLGTVYTEPLEGRSPPSALAVLQQIDDGSMNPCVLLPYVALAGLTLPVDCLLSTLATRLFVSILESMEVYEEGGLVRPRELGFAEERAHDR